MANRIRMSSSDMRRSFRDVIDAITRGDEIIVVHYNRPVALISPYQEDTTTSTTTTDYGTWVTLMRESTTTVEASVQDALGSYAADYDIPAVAAEYRAAINDLLPEGVTLNGNDLYGPHPVPAWWWDEDSDERLALRDAIKDLDFWTIAAGHESKRQKTAKYLANLRIVKPDQNTIGYQDEHASDCWGRYVLEDEEVYLDDYDTLGDAKAAVEEKAGLPVKWSKVDDGRGIDGWDPELAD